MGITVAGAGSVVGSTIAGQYAAGGMERRRKLIDEQAEEQRKLRGMEKQFGLREDLMELQAGLNLEKMYAQSDLEQQEWEQRLTPQQKADRERYANARYEIMNNPEWSEEEKQEALATLNDKVAAANKPISFRKEPSKWPQGQGVGEVWISKDGRLRLTRDPDGKVRKLGEISTGEPTHQDRIKAYKEIRDSMTRMDAEGNIIYPKHEDVMSAMDDFFGSAMKEKTGSAASAQSLMERGAPITVDDRTGEVMQPQKTGVIDKSAISALRKKFYNARKGKLPEPVEEALRTLETTNDPKEVIRAYEYLEKYEKRLGSK